MFTQAPEITVDATVGQVVSQSTATPTSTPVATSTAQSTATTPQASPVAPTKRYKQQALTIYGFGPINSEVTLKGFGVSEKVSSNSDGLFRFTEIYSLTYTYPELCIQAIDDQNRTTQPSCIPALPSNSLIPLEVGPVLLSPTISLSESRVKEGGQSVLSGKTTPNTKVNIFIAKKQQPLSKISLVKDVSAYSLPIVDTKSNEKGEYEISLPTGESAEFRLFASTKFGADNSAKSNTLTFSVLTEIKTMLEKLISFILHNKLMAFIFAEALVFVLLFVKALKSTTKARKIHSEKDYLEYLKLNQK